MHEKLKTILVVVESIDVEDSSGSKANVALIKNLHKAGFDLQVYHYTRNNIDLPGIPCYHIKENRKSFVFYLSRLERYLRYWLKINPNKYIENFFGFSFTLFNDRNSIVAGLKKIRDFEPDLVLTLSKGGSFRPHHALLKLPKWHLKWMAYIHDPYPMHAFPRPYDWVEPGHQQKRKFFLKVVNKARYAAYPSKLLADWMRSYYGELKGKTVIIPHQIDDDKFESPALPEFFKKEAFTIVHAGALMSARNPIGLIRAFKKFLQEMPEATSDSQLLFLGKKSRYSLEFEKIKEEIPQFFASEDYVPFSTVLAIQQNAAVNVILEAKGPISPFLPGKFPHCIQAEKPILLLGPYYSESRRLFGDDYPWWGEIDDEDKILIMIKELYHNWKTNQDKQAYDTRELKSYLSEKYLSLQLSKL
jgi:glycosyltransferase involved in cell wall biosynthesis